MILTIIGIVLLWLFIGLIVALVVGAIIADGQARWQEIVDHEQAEARRRAAFDRPVV